MDFFPGVLHWPASTDRSDPLRPLCCMATGDPNQLLTEAYDAYADAIFRHCYFRVFSRERGKELMQETFMRTWQYLSDGKTVDNMRAFLYRIANNLIVDESRKKRETSLEALQEAGFDPAGEDGNVKAAALLEERRVLETLTNLEKPYREVFIMRHIDGLKPAEIAELLGESANTVSVRLHRATEQLRKFLKP
ncbi:MAG TPA: RNA polymerase sigma factor [Candidatus Peribacteria bacterium]|nr:RNA polymerase sigma factor [Candidatus Peribacteria bacterium]